MVGDGWTNFIDIVWTLFFLFLNSERRMENELYRQLFEDEGLADEGLADIDG